MDGHLSRGWGRKAKLYQWCPECECERLIVKPGISVYEAHNARKGNTGEQEVLF